MKKAILLLLIPMLIFACGGNSGQNDNQPPTARPKSMIASEQGVDDGKGVGPVTSVRLNDPLVADMVDQGKGIYEMKCAACHKLTAQRVVGPGWEGLTSKRKPEWIMNMITNVEVMLKEDPTAKQLLKECLVAMPNQNLTIEDARNVLEFMYSIDGHEIGK